LASFLLALSIKRLKRHREDERHREDKKA